MKRPRIKIAVAPAAFKGTLTAGEAARAIAAGFKAASPIFLPVQIPMADGGGGTVEAALAAKGGRKVNVTVVDPLGRKIAARYAILADGKTAVIEMAAASGMSLLKKRELDPLRATTYGTGQLIASALDHGVRRIIVGVGDSATVDGGAGMAAALGARLLDKRGMPIPPGGGGLERLARIDASGIDSRVKETRITVAADVENPLLGKNGAARVFAPQKGATPRQVERLEKNLARLARIIRRDVGSDVRKVKYGGAAGGLGAGLYAFLGAELRSGAEVIGELIGLRKSLARISHHALERPTLFGRWRASAGFGGQTPPEAPKRGFSLASDPRRARLGEKCGLAGGGLVISGEGCIDFQTASGKAPAYVARTARELGLPVFVFGGKIGEGWERVFRLGVSAVLPTGGGRRVPDKKTAYRRLVLLSEKVGRVLVELASG